MTLIDLIATIIISILISILIWELLISHLFPSSKKYYKFKDGKEYQCTEGYILVNCNIIPLNTAFFKSYTLLDLGDNIYLVEKNYNKKQLKPGDIVLCSKYAGFSICEIIEEVGVGNFGKHRKFTVGELNCDFSKQFIIKYINPSYTATTDLEGVTTIVGKIIKDKRVRYITKKNK